MPFNTGMIDQKFYTCMSDVCTLTSSFSGILVTAWPPHEVGGSESDLCRGWPMTWDGSWPSATGKLPSDQDWPMPNSQNFTIFFWMNILVCVCVSEGHSLCSVQNDILNAYIVIKGALHRQPLRSNKCLSLSGFVSCSSIFHTCG